MLNPKDDMPLIFELIDLHLRQREISEHLIQRAASNEKVSARLENYLERLSPLDNALKEFIDSVEFSFEDEIYQKIIRRAQK